jgi:predicted MFS family arabinose efflux permease
MILLMPLPLAIVLEKALGAAIPVPARFPLASIGTNFAALATFTTFFGVWLVDRLGASAGEISIAYVIAGIAGVGGGYLGGRLTDKLGQRPVVRVSATLQAALATVLLIPGVGIGVACVVLTAMTFLQPLRGAAQRIALADSGSAEQREDLFAGYRLAVNLGTIAGPLLGAVLVDLSWFALHAGVVALYVLSLLLAARMTTGPRPGGTPRSSNPVAMLGDWRIYALVFASTCAWTVVYMYETVLPVALVQSYGLSPRDWGLVYALGPALVVFFQLRVGRRLSRVGAGRRLAVGTVLMGGSFTLLIFDGSLWVVLLLALIFVSGDMIWGPASETVSLRLAPPEQRGAYVGVITSSIWLGSAVAAGAGFPLRQALGNSALWVITFAVGILSGAVYLMTEFWASRTLKRVIES